MDKMTALLWALALAIILGVAPDYAERVHKVIKDVVCQIQAAALKRSEEHWVEDRIKWHTEYVRADGVTLLDQRHLCR